MRRLSSGSSKAPKQRALEIEGEEAVGTPRPPPQGQRARPFVKWAGGKQKLARLYETRGLLPKFTGTYYEGFVGGGALFFHLRPEKAVLIDNNKELVTTYNVVKSQVNKLIEALRQHEERHRRDGAQHYYSVRGETPSRAVDRAARFIYLNKTCFNGLYRVNSAGEFNVPMGEYKSPRIVDEAGLRAASRALKTATIRHGEYLDVEEFASKGDFVYFDPPYDPLEGKSSFTSYTKKDFGPLDQITLRDLFARLAKRGIRSVVSNSDTGHVRGLYDNWWIHDIPAVRAINSVGSSRGAINELAISNFKPKPIGTLDAFGDL